uniref:MIP18 family-like domain-containing protein n=1 Tax=Ananas comosus var. bracteatus TaxID=296719 RepID=A0A6V7Q1V9_ANACO|nr:unnamed protein product [Ananas comosus var. bracteatus]
MVAELINANPVVYERKERRDPEHPYSLEQLNVVTDDAIEVNDEKSHVRVTFTPTVEHCSMATIIGLCLRVKLIRSLPSRYKVDIRIAPGTHATEATVNKQLNDKERVAAALENPTLLEVIEDCLSPHLPDAWTAAGLLSTTLIVMLCSQSVLITESE